MNVKNMKLLVPTVCGLIMIVLFCVLPIDAKAISPDPYDDLVNLFSDWRIFQRPIIHDGVPDYTESAMQRQHDNLDAYQQRLAQLDTTGWSIPHQVDYMVVKAEMDGLDFYHRVHRPWQRDPSFYISVFASPTDVPAREGPVIEGAIDLYLYSVPLASDQASALTEQIRAIPAILDQARVNLTGNARDLWVSSIRRMSNQTNALRSFENRIAGTNAMLDAAVLDAIAATEAFIAWLKHNESDKTGPSGIGKENYNWYLKNVHLVPFTWEEEVAIMQRELARSHAALRLMEHNNRDLPELAPVADEATYKANFEAAVNEYMAFLDEDEIVPIREYMLEALLARMGSFSPPGEPRGFFTEVNYRDQIVMRTHHYHWLELARIKYEPNNSPIRRAKPLYTMYDGRAEGLATGMEEMMMHAGLLDDKPRAKELIYILLAQRAARAFGDLMMHANEITMDEALEFAAKWTPRGWMPANSNTVWSEQHLYLQQPVYGTSYVIGKIEIENLLAERALQLGDRFSLKEFMDDINNAGVIPVSLVRWEWTGQKDATFGLWSTH